MDHTNLVYDCGNEHGEAVICDPRDGRILWSDISGKALWSFDPETGKTTSTPLSKRLCAFAPCDTGDWLMAFDDQIELWTAGFAPLRPILEFEPDNAETRLNDGRVDRDGGFVVGGMNEVSFAHDSSVLRLAGANGEVTSQVLLRGISCANATCFSPDGGTMYFCDTPTRRVLAYSYEAGRLGPARVIYETAPDEGMPDGACVDAQGGVWVALWEGAAVIRIAPDGTVSHRINLPVRRPTCCTFGGPGLATLYITSSRLGASEEELAQAPLSGALFSVVPGEGIAGVPDGLLALNG